MVTLLYAPASSVQGRWVKQLSWWGEESLRLCLVLCVLCPVPPLPPVGSVALAESLGLCKT